MAGKVNRKEVFITEIDTIRKSNELSTAKMNQGLTLKQMQLLSYAIFATQRDGSTQFNKASFEKKFEIDEYRTEHAVVDSKKILGIQAGFYNEDGDTFEYLNVFKKMKYERGTFTFVWNEEITPHILELKDRYVLTDLKITSNFKSGFSWVLYDYLRGHYGNFYINIKKTELLELFGVSEKKSYVNNTAKFKQSVLDVAVDEINEFTELEVSYEEIKKGRSITGFTLKYSTGKQVKRATEEQFRHLNLLLESVLNQQTNETIATIEDESVRDAARKVSDYFLRIKESYLADDKKENLKNEDAQLLVSNCLIYHRKLNELLAKNNRSYFEEYWKKQKERFADEFIETDDIQPVPMINWLKEQ